MNVKNYIGKIITLTVLMVSVNVFAGPNTISMTPGIKFSDDLTVVAPVIAFEYERNILPMVSLYGKFGSSDFSDDGVDVSFSNSAFGARFNVFIVYLGVGYETTSIDYEDTLLSYTATGEIKGMVLEIGKRFGIGPISAGVSYGLQFASVDVEYNSTVFNVPFEASDSVVLTRFEASLGFNF